MRSTRCILAGLLFAFSSVAPAGAETTAGRAQREMQIHRVAPLGLEIWIENQPPWTGHVSSQSGHPTFYAQSPDDFYPPTVMSFASWPRESVAQESVKDMATKAIKQASLNFGLTPAQSASILALKAQYGVLGGYEAIFTGQSDGVPMDVMIFVGQQPGKFPVALSMYTVQGKINALAEHRRRAWTKISYLKAAPK